MTKHPGTSRVPDEVIPHDDGFLGALADATPSALMALARDGRVLYWNWGAEQMYGYPRDLAVGRPVSKLIVTPDRLDEVRSAHDEAVETGTAIYESIRRTKAGEVLQVSAFVRAWTPAAGDGVILLVSENDITEQKRIEQELGEQVWSLTGVEAFMKSILDASADYSIIALDLTGRIDAWNAGARNDFGYEADHAKGKIFESLVSAADVTNAAAVRRAYETTLAEGKHDREFIFSRRDGRRFPARVTFSLRRGMYGDPLGFVLISKDVTQEKDIEKERRLAYEREVEIQRLREVNGLKARLINTASHELNTPLTPIRMQLHILDRNLQGELTEGQARAFAIIQRNFERLEHVVRDVIAVANIEGGRLSVQKRSVALGKVVERAVESYKEAAEVARISLEADVGQPLSVDGDPHRLDQAVEILVDNALKFTSPEGRVIVRSRMDAGHVVLEVVDTGCGLSKDQIAQLFEPFSQVHDTNQMTRAGAGLGLYIAKGIAEAHGGAIFAASDGPGRGATFRIVLPSKTRSAA